MNPHLPPIQKRRNSWTLMSVIGCMLLINIMVLNISVYSRYFAANEQHAFNEAEVTNHKEQTSSNPDSFNDKNNNDQEVTNGREEARVVMGIFSVDETPLEETFRNEFRKLFVSHPYVCTLEKAMEDPLNRSCKFIYAFVIGGNKDPHAPTEILDHQEEIILPEKPKYNEVEHGDMIFLNIRENMNDGKSFTWLNYASNYLSGPLGLDYIGKMDIDTMLLLDRYFEFSNKFMSPIPYNRNTLIGNFVAKQHWGKKYDEAKEIHFIKHWTWVHIYAAGEMYILSTDLAKSTVQFIEMNPVMKDIGNARNYLAGHEDHDVSTFAFISANESKDPMTLVMIPRDQKWWRHPLKRKGKGNRWTKTWRLEQERIKRLFSSNTENIKT